MGMELKEPLTENAIELLRNMLEDIEADSLKVLSVKRRYDAPLSYRQSDGSWMSVEKSFETVFHVEVK